MRPFSFSPAIFAHIYPRVARAEEHLAGHAFHTYRLTSPDGLVTFEFKVCPPSSLCVRSSPGIQHNVCGRSIYAEGTVDAVLFIAAKSREAVCTGARTVFSMVDVASELGGS